MLSGAWRAAVEVQPVECDPRHENPAGQRRTLGQGVQARAAGSKCNRGCLRSGPNQWSLAAGGKAAQGQAGAPSGRGGHAQAVDAGGIKAMGSLASSTARPRKRPQRLVVLCKRPSNNAIERTVQQRRFACCCPAAHCERSASCGGAGSRRVSGTQALVADPVVADAAKGPILVRGLRAAKTGL